MKKTLGVLGGMGPFATLSFFGEILRHTKADKDWEHVHTIIDNNIAIPSRTRAVLYGEESPAPAMRRACLNLMDMGCDYIVVPCNSAHYFYEEVVDDTDIPWINMIEVVSRSVMHYDRVLILGGYVTVTKRLYDRYLNNTVYLNDYTNVYNLIESIKNGNMPNDEIDLPDIDCVLLACTELPIVMSTGINTNEIYAKEAIRLCGGQTK